MSENLNNVMNMLEEAKLEYKIENLRKEVENEVLKNEITIDQEDKDKLRNFDLISKVNFKLTILSDLFDKVDKVSYEVKEINNSNLYDICKMLESIILYKTVCLKDKYSL